MRWPIILRILLPLVVGVIVHFYTNFAFGLTALIVLLSVLLFLNLPIFRLKSRSFFFVSVMTIFFFSLGGYLASIHKSVSHPNYFECLDDGYQEEYVVKVMEPPEEKVKSVKCMVEVLQKNRSQTMGKALIYFSKDEASMNIQYGDLIVLKTNFQKVQSNGNPREFDYARYLRIHDIYHQAYVKSSDWKLADNDANPFFKLIFQWREHLSGVLEKSGMKRNNVMVAKALLLGQKEFLDKDVLRSYSSAGAMHVLAVSGLHVGIVMLILQFLLKPFKKIKFGNKVFVLFVLIGIWLYALITGMSPSVMRAAVMFSFIVIGNELQRDTTVYQSIFTSAFLLILIDPYIIFQVGFQLSYLAVLGIVYLQPKIENLIYVENKLLHKAWQITAVSIAAQIATFPLGLFYFHQFPNFFMISNLLVIPLAFFILMIGIAYLVFHLIPILGELLFYLLDSALSFLNYGVSWIEQLPYSIVWGISIEWYEVFVLYFIILSLSVAFAERLKKIFFLGLSGIVLLVGLNVMEKINLESSNQFVIYNISDELAIDVFYGRKNLFVSSKELMDNEEKLLFHVKHNWFYRTAEEDPSQWKDIATCHSLKIKEKRFWLADSTQMAMCEKKIPYSDYVVLYNMSYVKSEIIEKWEETKSKIILTSNINYRLQSYLYKRIDSTRIYNVSQQGAFIQDF